MKAKRLAKMPGVYIPSLPGNPKDDDRMEALTREARQLGQAGKQFAKAVEVNTRILEFDPDNLPALTRRGLSYLKLDDYPSAREDLSHALRLYPGSSLVKEALEKIEREWDAALGRARRRGRCIPQTFGNSVPWWQRVFGG